MAFTHIFFVTFPAWGHAKPFCILAARLVKEYPEVVLTLLLPPSILKKAEDEVEEQLREAASEEMRKRIRIITSFQMTQAGDPFAAIQQTISTYPDFYTTIHDGKSVVCATNGTVFEAVEPPSVVIMDLFTYPQLKFTKSISGDKIPIFAWLTGKAASLIRLFGPESLGGFGDMTAKVEAEAARLGVTPKEIGDKFYNETTGKVIKLAGIPEMYDYEFFPQDLPFDIPVSELFKGSYSFLQECDGVFAVNTPDFEGEAISAIRAWLTDDLKKEVYAVGPILPLGYGVKGQSDRGATDIKDFLDRMLETHGKKSTMLISFGTIFWPPNTAYLEEVIECLISMNFPFILSHASPFAKISDVLKEKIKLSGIGITTTWCPQQYILGHEATGWFLTHCGHNSITESIGSGVPMIAWPFNADQPEGAYELDNAGLGIELLQVRTGEHAKKPLRRNGKGAAGTREAVGTEIRDVIASCRGEKGAQIRKNVENMKNKFLGSWETEGEARKEFNRFLSKYTDLRVA
ncbi:UDP-Glycosyltransferase/glycogen phosphorylase [Agrocybe pediades]|nr:UDP-Glycosyltransferase/glycogen phosphorylase [Agrocybe pediades]